ncbi:hypothetical protein Tdes44962_MAKER06203 [Teratosphaeria destructans]|uniref:Secreted protein n=1 Tax=Teratosphaeria destructans TaxID=418781 RepID=A0A9W7SHV8_9PEZI|nr:hypothetical protein Tdes44962_MAKER06203 [Teratosphaeria destructans]
MNALLLALACLAPPAHERRERCNVLQESSIGSCLLTPFLTQTEGNCWNRYMYGKYDRSEYAKRDCDLGVCDFYCNVP